MSQLEPGTLIAINIGRLRGIGKIQKIEDSLIHYCSLSDPFHTKTISIDSVYALPEWSQIEPSTVDLTFKRDLKLGSLHSALIAKSIRKRKKPTKKAKAPKKEK